MLTQPQISAQTPPFPLPISFPAQLSLGHIDAQAKLLAPTDVEAQAEVIGSCVEVDDASHTVL